MNRSDLLPLCFRPRVRVARGSLAGAVRRAAFVPVLAAGAVLSPVFPTDADAEPIANATLSVPPPATITAGPAPWERSTLRVPGAAGMIKLSPPRVANAPSIDGKLDDDVWASAAVLDSFTFSRPIEGLRDSLGTVALVMYDHENLYVAFRALDDPRVVQAPITPRDAVWQGDWVGVSIDTYHDQQRSFFLCANPVGIQMDGVDQEGRDSDMAPDFQYTSKGRVTPYGYEVEMAIPFKTLRFQPGENVTFGFQAIRDVKRSGGHMYWAPVSRNINSYHAQIGTLSSLSGIKPGRNVQITPEWTTTTLGQRTDGSLQYDQPEGRFGVTGKVGITSNVIADVAVTPDFSQVEADAGVVDVNERFAIFYAEKRPFFLEGSDVFTTPINLVYTRRIVDPLYGVKLTGKVGRTSLGILQAADRSVSNGVDGLPNEVNPYMGDNGFFTIGRVRQDVFKNSYVGLLAGDFRQNDRFTSGISTDGRLRWADKYSFTFQGAHSWRKDADFRSAVGGLSPGQIDDLPPDVRYATGERTQGDAYYAEMARDTRPLNVGASAYGYSPDFSADMGFVRRTDLSAFSGWVRPHIWGKEKQWYTGIHFPMYYEVDYNWEVSQKTDEVLSLVQEVQFPANSWAGVENVVRYIRYNGVEFKDMYRHAIWLGSEKYRTVRPSALVVWGDQVVFAETVPGRDLRYELAADLRFSSQFDGGVSYLASSVWRKAGDAKFADVKIPRVRLSYQFTKEFSLRWITELQAREFYDASGTLTNKSQLLTPDVLLSYYVRPGTVVYLGYGSQLFGLDTQKLEPYQASVFTKVSYLWQM